MNLIKSTVNHTELLTEEVNGKKHYYVEGIFLMGDYVNKNKRVYPLSVLEPEVNRYRTEYIERSRAMGELGHPDTPVIILENVSHNIISLTRDGNNYIGKAKILESVPKGKIAVGLLQEGIVLGTSSRGVGSIKESRGSQIVQDDFCLTTAGDLVADPSAPLAFMQALREEKQWILDSGIWSERQLNTLQKNVKKKSFKTEHFLADLTTFLRGL